MIWISNKTMVRIVVPRLMRRSKTEDNGTSAPDGVYTYMEIVIGAVSTSEYPFNIYNSADMGINRGIVYS